MAEVTWFKVLTDIFSDDKIKIMQSMPEGDSITVMWFKVLAQAGKTNDGGYIYLRKNIPYTAGMLATLFNKPQQLVELALRTFSEFGMIDIDDKGYIFITNWEKHQSIDKLNQIKEKNRLRVQSHREKKKQELLQCNVTETLPSHQSNAIDIEVDIDKEKDKRTTATAEAITEIQKGKAEVATAVQINPFRLFESEGFGTLSSVIGEKIGDFIDTYGERWTCEAMKEAAYYQKRNLPYVKSILDRYKTSGVDEPWKKKEGAKHGETTEGVRQGSHAGTIKPSESQSGILPSRWLKLDEDGNLLPVSGMQG